MSDYISREKIRELFNAAALSPDHIKMQVYPKETVARIIYDCPEVDVRENVHGEWIKNEENIYHCSKCGRTVKKDWVEDMQIDYPFCHCGADMRCIK